MDTLTVERLRKVLDYDPTTGVFRWRVQPRNGVRIGAVAGRRHSGHYCQIGIDGSVYLAHRLAWLHVTGHWPTSPLDHRNGVITDNRLANLREDPHRQNPQNQHGPSRRSSSGYLGVHRNGRRWRGVIKVNGRNRYLGYFDTPEQASVAYTAAKRKLHPFWVGSE